MKKNIYLISFLLIGFLFNCSSNDQPIEGENVEITASSILGKWNLIGGVTSTGEEIINESSCSFYQFYPNGSVDYKSCSDNVHTGTYVLSGTSLQLNAYNNNNENLRATITDFSSKRFKLNTFSEIYIMEKDNP